MKQLTTTGIILQRTDYGEADRILVMLTPDYGKLHVLAKGVRKVKSKLAGGIELFSVSQLTFIEGRQGRHGLGTLISSRLVKHYSGIVKDVDRTMLGYDLIRQLHKATEDELEADYFELLEQALIALEDPAVSLDTVRLWFAMQLLRLAGHTPNLQTDTAGHKLQPDQTYIFSFDDMALAPRPAAGHLAKEPIPEGYGYASATPEYSQGGQTGHLAAPQIKFLRLGFAGYTPRVLQQVQGSEQLVKTSLPLVQAMAQNFIHM